MVREQYCDMFDLSAHNHAKRTAEVRSGNARQRARRRCRAAG